MNNNKTVILVVGGVVLLIVVMVLVGRNKSVQTTPKSTAQQIVKSNNLPTATNPASSTGSANGTTQVGNRATVNISSDKGMVPKEVTIKVGGIVKFVNSDTRVHQIASNPHPVHSDLPELSSGSLGPGESYSFAFTKVGTWGYHDHLNPSLKGTVIVTR